MSDEIDSSEKSKKEIPRGMIPRERKSSYIHIRVDPDFKEQVIRKAEEEEMNLTNFVVLALEDKIYEEMEEEESEEEEEDEEDLLREEILTAMENLERRMEIRLAALQDAFNSLIGKLLDFERSGASLRSRKKKKRDRREDDDEESYDFELDNILQMDPEMLIYQRVKRYIESKAASGARVPSFGEIVAHLETDKKVKNYLDAQDKNFPGWKDTLIRDAIDEAIDELGIPIYHSGGVD